MEEIYLEGPLGNTDIRIINSYPSKVEHACPELQKSAKVLKSPRQKSPQDRTQQSRHSAVPHRATEADSYLAPGAIEKHVAPPETGVVAFPSSCEKLVTLGYRLTTSFGTRSNSNHCWPWTRSMRKPTSRMVLAETDRMEYLIEAVRHRCFMLSSSLTGLNFADRN
jgi:hypothetical protein